MQKRLGIAIAITAVSGGLLLFAQAPRSGEVQFKAAQHLEQVEGDLAGAIEAYQEIADSGDRVLAARALVAIGHCYEKLGAAESRRAYERVIQEFADQADPVTTARTRLAALDAGAENGRIVVRKLLEGSLFFGRPSHDGRFLPISRRGSILVRDLVEETERLVAPAPTSTGQELDDSLISHDNGQLAYVLHDYSSDRPGNRFELRVAKLDGSGDRLLFEDRTLSILTLADWSPTMDQFLAIARASDDTCQLLLVNASDGSRTMPHEIPACHSVQGLFSPDGMRIIFTVRLNGQESRDILSVPINGGEPAQMVVHPADDSALGWSADGRLVFGSDRSGTSDIWSVRVTGGRAIDSPELLKRDVGDASAMGFRRNGAYFYRVQTGGNDVYTASLDPRSGQLTSGPTPLPGRYVGASGTPDYSRDGRFLAYASGPRDAETIRIRNLETGEESDPLKTPFGNFAELTWFPDGRSILLQGRSRDGKSVFYRSEATTGQGSVLLDNYVTNDGATNPTFDPKGEWLYFKTRSNEESNGNRTTRIVRYALASGELETVAESSTDRWIRMFALSPDGDQLALSIRTGEIDRVVIVPVSGGEPRTLYTYPEGIFQRGWGALEFTGDGTAVLHQVDGEDGNWWSDQLLLTPLNGGPTQKLADTGMIHQITVHPDGRRIAWQAQTGTQELWVMENLAPAQTAER